MAAIPWGLKFVVDVKRGTVAGVEIPEDPTKDMVKVVRCKDCIYGIESEQLFADNEKHYMCFNSKNGTYVYHKSNHFCGYGKRKDGAE